MSKRVALASAVVVAAMVAAVLGATAALRLIGVGAFGPGGQPLSESQVRRSLDAATRSAGATPTPVPSSSRAGHSPTSGSSGGTGGTGGTGGRGRPGGARLGAFSSAGGTVFASCTAAGQATLSRWIPASGYSTDGYGPGPASSVWVKFKSGSSELTVTVDCVGGKPHLVTSTDDHGGGGGDDHGGGGDDGGRSGGSGGGSGGGGSGGGSGGGGRSGGK